MLCTDVAKCTLRCYVVVHGSRTVNISLRKCRFHFERSEYLVVAQSGQSTWFGATVSKVRILPARLAVPIPWWNKVGALQGSPRVRRVLTTVDRGVKIPPAYGTVAYTVKVPPCHGGDSGIVTHQSRLAV